MLLTSDTVERSLKTERFIALTVSWMHNSPTGSGLKRDNSRGIINKIVFIIIIIILIIITVSSLNSRIFDVLHLADIG